MLHLNSLNVFYDLIQVLYNISINVDKKEYVVLLGPNGHGKTTLLKTICGLIPASSGNIKFSGKEISNIPVTEIVRQGLVYISEDRNLFPEMTVIDNLKMGAYTQTKSSRTSESLEYVFDLFPRLKNRKKQLASTLSGGEGRMLAIGRGLMSGAKFLAIDEPSLGLAPKIVWNLFETIDNINKNGTTILLVEQNIQVAIQHAQKIYLLKNGEIKNEYKKNEIDLKEIQQFFLGKTN